MTHHRSILAAASLLATTIPAAFGLTVPVQEDSFSSDGNLSSKSGKAMTLNVSDSQVAFVKFNFNDAATVPFNIVPGNIVSANLRVYLGKAKTPGNLTIHAVTSAWTEDTGGPAPSFNPTPIATLVAGAQTNKDFAVFNIAGDIGNFNVNGFAIVSDAGKLTIPSKESALPACELNIETNYADDGTGTYNIATINVGTLNATAATANEVNTPTLNVNDIFASSSLRTDGTNGGFFANTGFPLGGTTTLVGAFSGKGGGPQLRFVEPAFGDFHDIGQDGGGNFVIENGFDVGVLKIQQNGRTAVGSGNSAFATLQVDHTVSGAAQDVAFAVRRVDGAGDILYVRNFAIGGVFNLELFEGNAFKPGGGAWGVVSDQRLKKDIVPLDGALDQLLKLRSVTYEYIDPAARGEAPGRQIGFLAQEVEKIFPDWVGEKGDGYKYIAVKGFESLTVQALRELRAEQDAQIKKLGAENAALAAKVEALEARFTRLAESLDESPARAVRTALK